MANRTIVEAAGVLMGVYKNSFLVGFLDITPMAALFQTEGLYEL